MPDYAPGQVFDLMGAMGAGQRHRANEFALGQAQDEAGRQNMFRNLIGGYLGPTGEAAAPSMIPGGAPQAPQAMPETGGMPGVPPDQVPQQDPGPFGDQAKWAQLAAIDPGMTAQLMDMQAARYNAQQAQIAAAQQQRTQMAKKAVMSAQYIAQSANPHRALQIGFPGFVKQLADQGVDVATLDDDKVRELAYSVMEQMGPEAGIAPAGEKPGEQFTLGEGQKRFDANGKLIASVDPRASNEDTDRNSTRQFGQENILRDEFTAQTAAFRDLQSSYQTIKTLGQNASPAGDIATVAAFMRAVDPGSRVTGAEQATAQNSGGVPAIIRGYYNKLVGGGELSPSQRADFLKQAGSLVEGRRPQYDIAKKKYTGLATRAGLNPANVIGDEEEAPAAATAPPAGSPKPGTIEDGYVYTGGDPANPASWRAVK